MSITAANAADRTTRESGRPAPLATLEIEAAPVQVKPAGKASFADAKDGRALKAGDTVRTGTTGRAQIDYADGSLTRLDVATEYQLVKLSSKKGDRKTKGVQTAGQTWHRVEALTESESYKVEGANASAAVLGTAFFVSCDAPNSCTFTAVIDDIRLVDSDARGGTKTVTLSPGDQVEVDGNAIGTVSELTQEELLAIQWIVQNLIADQNDGKSTGTSEIGTQADPPPTRPPSSPVTTPPPLPPATGAATSATTGAGGGSSGGDDGTGTDNGGAGMSVVVNLGPSAGNDAYSIPEDALLAIGAPGVLGNDSDPEGSPLQAFLTSLPANGALLFNGDGSFVYDPDANFNGVDSFTYVAGDGEFGSLPATVTITVSSVNDAPVAIADSYAMPEDAILNIAAPGVLGNDADPESAPLLAIATSQPANGALAFSASGAFTYTPNPNFNGVDSFTYQATDGALSSDITTVAITVGAVDDRPIANPDGYATPEDTALAVAAPGVLANDFDIEGSGLTAVLVIGPVHAEPGNFALAADGSFTYTPDENYHGPDSFTYMGSAGGQLSSIVTVTITVSPINDTPVADDDAYTIAEDGVLEVAAPGVLGNDADADADATTATLVTGPEHGELSLAPDGSFTYTPDENYHGPDSFTYYASDATAPSDTATVTITVSPVEDAPVAMDDPSYEVDENNALEVAAPGVLGNDSDADGDPLTATLDDEQSPLECEDYYEGGCGTLVFPGDGSFTYTPPEGFFGVVTFTYVLSDGTEQPTDSATVTITVNPSAPLVNVYPEVPCAAQGDDAYFTIEVVDGSGLEISITAQSSQGPPGELVVGEPGQEGNLWFFNAHWDTTANEASDVTLTIRVSNGVTYTDKTFTIDYVVNYFDCFGESE